MKKVIFVDFDDTICLHKFHIDVDERLFDEVSVACENFYSKSDLNKSLYNYLIEMKKNGARIILLTSACSKMLDIKKYWIEKNCSLVKFDDYISASIDINKTQIMQAYAKHNNTDIKDIILIDDSCIERRVAEECGFLTYNPQLIMNK